MGQSINVLLYGARIPDDVDTEDLCERWSDHIAPKVEAFRDRLRSRGTYKWWRAMQAYEPRRPMPDDAKPDNLLGFYICRGHYDDGESHQFPAMTFAEMRTNAPTAVIIKRCRRRWSRFARWARAQGVEFGRPRIWRTRTEVA